MRTFRLPSWLILLILTSFGCAGTNPITPTDISQGMEGVVGVAISVPLNYVRYKYPDSPAIGIIMTDLQYAYTDIGFIINQPVVDAASITADLIQLWDQMNEQFNLVDPNVALIFTNFLKGVTIAVNKFFGQTTTPELVVEFGGELRNALQTGSGGVLTVMGLNKFEDMKIAKARNKLSYPFFPCADNPAKICY